MRTSIYLLEGEEIRRRDNTIYIGNSEGSIYLPVKSIGDIYVFDNISLNVSLLELCTKEKIILHFHDYYGNYIGSYNPRNYKNKGEITVAQVAIYKDEEKRLKLAQTIVASSINSMLQNIKYYGREDPSLEEIGDRLNLYKNRVAEIETISQLMGIEANSKKHIIPCSIS